MGPKNDRPKFKCDNCKSYETCYYSHCDGTQECTKTLCSDCEIALKKSSNKCEWCENCEVFEENEYKDPKGRLKRYTFCSSECFENYWIDCCLGMEPEPGR